MCGIIGYTGSRQASPILLEGLSRLEYRGYDSAGIAVIGPDGGPVVRKLSGKLSRLKAALESGLPQGVVGIGHTRWATHGGVTDYNAHPHMDCRSEVMVVHNGIVENYVELKQELARQGHEFLSQTDTECIPHLIESYLAQEYSLSDAVRATAERMRGANAVVVISTREPGKIAGFRLGHAGGILVGHGENEMLLASDLPALVPHTRDVVYLEPSEMVLVDERGARYSRIDGATVEKSIFHVPYDDTAASKGEYKHFMLKEINEQPERIVDALRGRVSFDTGSIELEEIPFSDEELAGFNRVVLLGMGTSLHAAMVGSHWFESLARIPASADNSSEFRYRDPILDDRTLVVSVSQSGETADTLAAMTEAAEKGARQITLCNFIGPQSTRIADGTILLRAGPETAVASTKTFTCSLAALYLMALHLGVKRGTLGREQLESHMRELARLPEMVGSMLSDREQKRYEALAHKYFKCENFLYLGRGNNFPLAMEGALKLKEISYIHAEGYPAGEMKHGPISLIDENMPVVALIPRDNLYEKMLSNINEVKARDGIVLAVATEGDTDIAAKADHVIYIPQASPSVTPILMAVPMQLLSYHIAVRRGCDVDQPRNLAKSVTVE
jgi:glucosamine--fructose-6-phosphate aminotransferase (isomerizing)